MVQGIEATQNLPLEGRRSLTQIIGDVGAGKVAVIALCALVGAIAGNAIYDFAAVARASYAFIQKTKPSVSYLNATRSPPVDYERVQQAAWDFGEAVDDATIPALLRKGDQCWEGYDAGPSWSQFDQCAGYDIGLGSYATPRQIEAYAQQSGYPSVMDRKADSFLISKAEALGGELVAIQRVNDIAMTIQIDNR